MIIHAFETFRLDYCNAFYIGLSLKITQKLQLVQNVVAFLCDIIAPRAALFSDMLPGAIQGTI